MTPFRLFIASALVALAAAVACSQTQDAATKFRLAQAFEMSGNYDQALALYRELARKEPGNYVFFDGFQRTLVQLKRYDEAISLVRTKLDANPADLNLRMMLAGIYQRAGMEQQAREEWDRAIALNPMNANNYRIVANSMIEHRLLERAGEIYRRARSVLNDPDLFALELAQLEVVMMDYAGASAELVAWLRKNPAQVSFVQGRLAAFAAKPDGRLAAIAAVEQALRDREDVHLYELLGWLYLEGKEYGQAYTAYQSIDKLTRAQGGALLQFADRAFKEQAFDIAARAYQEAIHVPLPANKIPPARYGYANALKEIAQHTDTVAQPITPQLQDQSGVQSRYGDALAAYQSIIRDFPRTEFSAKAYYKIGTIKFENLFDLSGALASFQKVDEEAGSTVVIKHDVALKVGLVYLAQGDTVHARIRFASVAGSPGATPDQDDEATIRLAELEFFSGRPDSAIARLEGILVNTRADYANDALQLQAFLQENLSSARPALIQYGRAELLARQKKNTEAAAFLEKIVEQYPASLLVDDALMRIAGLQSEAGLYSSALASYNRLLTQFKESSIALDRARFGVGEVYEFGLHDKDRAIAEYEKLLAEYPGSVLAGLARKRIRVLRGDPL